MRPRTDAHAFGPEAEASDGCLPPPEIEAAAVELSTGLAAPDDASAALKLDGRLLVVE
jgi:hypothetical protein